MAEKRMDRVAFVVGAASQIGAALLNQKRMTAYTHVVLADAPSRTHIVRALVKLVDRPMEQTSILRIDSRQPFAGVSFSGFPLDTTRPVDIFYLAHSRDRSLPASELRGHNELMFERILSIAYKLKQVHSLVVVTDIGLIGDYPGRFSENWIDVGQIPFDEVDRSSMAIELACLKEPTLPIIRARVGLVLDPEGISASLGHWPPARDTFIGFYQLLKLIPRIIKIPIATAKGALAPITPSDLAAEALLLAVDNPESQRGALHVVMEPAPTIDATLDMAARRIGGARLKSGLPVDLVAKFGHVPGFRELARRNADQLAAWWTPHRYCLSQNNVDTARLKTVLPDNYVFPKWKALENRF